ncbi:MAG: hypothetical protein K2Z81_22640 [Cyanobacteria bacterium]|nr:hypothetical protein [Cyanobacteriota bacterium]
MERITSGTKPSPPTDPKSKQAPPPPVVAPTPTPAPPVVAAPPPAAAAAAAPKPKDNNNLRNAVLKNAALNTATGKPPPIKLPADDTSPAEAMKSPRKLSQLPLLPGKDLIEDMKKSVYLPRQRDFTSMRQERKAVEKAVHEGKEDPSVHFSVVGSPDYMAVEVLRGDGYTSCVDFWAIGCMLYEMIFGFPPFFGESPEEVFMNIVNYDQCLAFPEPGQGPEISPEGESIIRALLTEPDRRLGAKGGLKEIKQHPFFKDFPWDTILQEEPPFVPDLSGIDDYSRFHVHNPEEHQAPSGSRDEPPPDSPFEVERASSPVRDDDYDSPRDFDEAGLTDDPE